MDTDYFDNKKPILIFGLFLNTAIMIVMYIVVFEENISVSNRVVEFCYFMFIVNIIITGIYSVIIILFSVRIVLEYGGKLWNKVNPVFSRWFTPTNLTMTKEGSPESDGNQTKETKNKIKFMDYVKDPAVIFGGLFLIFAVLTFTFYFTQIPWYLIIISFVLAISMGILFLMQTRKNMFLTYKIVLVVLGIFLVIFIFTVIWDNLAW